MDVLGALAGLGLAAIVLFVAFMFVFQFTRSLVKLKNLKDPTRKLTQTEKNYITPYLDKYELALRSDDIYEVTGGELAYRTFSYQGNATTHKIFAGIELITPYNLDMLMRGDDNTAEIAVTKSGTSKTAGMLFGAVISVNGVNVTEWAETAWREGKDGEDGEADPLAMNITKNRKESDLEAHLRRNHLWYGASMVYVWLMLLCLLATIYLPALWSSWTYSIIALLFALLAGTSFAKTYLAHKPKQDVLTAKGRITKLSIERLQSKFLSSDDEFYFGPQYHLRFPDDKQKTEFRFGGHNNETEYTAELTAHKSSGYQLLELNPFQSVFERYCKQSKVLNLRTLLWAGGAVIALGLAYPFYNQLDITPESIFQNTYNDSPETRTYANHEELANDPPALGDRLVLNSNQALSCAVVTKLFGANAPDCNVIILGEDVTRAAALPDYIQNQLVFNFKPRNVRDDFGSGYGADKIVTSPTYISDIDSACAFDPVFDCNVIYQELVDRFSPNGDNSEMSNQAKIDEIKGMLSQPIIRFDFLSYSLLSSSIRTWVQEGAATYWQNYFADQPESDRSITSHNGVTIELPTGYFYKFDEHAVVPMTGSYREGGDNYWINAGKIVSAPLNETETYRIEGNVVGVERQGTTTAIKLSTGDPVPYHKTIAFILTIVLSTLILLAAIVQYFYKKLKIRSAIKHIKQESF
ncbi:hypothetical protein [Psychrobacter sp. AOP7-B1-24]|uniref:hypothetical protein n=1 Tax=Psychrobacter sp. AOP7-B1-24 TaxID=3457645 RepID=UPI00402B5F25